MKARYLEWSSFSVLAIPGISGSGKTSTARFILAQLALNGVGLVVCDPHGNSGQENLATSIAALSNAFILPIAIDKADRMTAIRLVAAEMQRRLEGASTEEKIALVIDETTTHFLACSPSEVKETARLFLSLANEARKTNIRVVLLGQNWKADYVGARDVRSSITHVLFHRISEDEIKLFVPSMPASERRKIATMKPGKTFLYPDMVTLAIPYITQDDISVLQIAPTRTALARHARIVQKSQEAPQSELARICTEILRMKKEGLSKEATILQLFSIKKSGTSERWKIASRLYDNVVKRAYDIQNEKNRT